MFTRNSQPHAQALPLKEWQDPVEDVVLLFSECRCSVYFRVGDSPKVGMLTFSGVWAVRSVRSEVSPHLDTKHNLSSYLLQVFNSVWPREVEGAFYTPDSKQRLHSEAKHFIVKGHDIYHEILCRSYTEDYLDPSDTGHAAAMGLLTAA
jgi:hypothetical protein